MNLKEAFAYRNFLSSMFSELRREAMATDAFCIIKEEHLKSKADPGAEDEICDSRAGTLQTVTSVFEAPGELAQVDPDKIIAALEALKDEEFALGSERLLRAIFMSGKDDNDDPDDEAD